MANKLTVEDLLGVAGVAGGTAELGASARNFVTAAAKFIEELAKNEVELDFGEAENTSNEIDYNAPVSDSYRKSYKPITTTEIVEANKNMSEAIAGEKWCEGFLMAIKFMLLVK